MPLNVESGRVPPRWMAEGKCRKVACAGRDYVNVALINNMPDAALEDTELQFFSLLDDASGDIPIYLKLYSLTGIPRTDRGQRHLNSFYYSLDELWQGSFDGVIITGTEPRQPDLRDEPYWSSLAGVFDWAERNTSSAILSCLAAHASVLHSDGIHRHRLPDKQFGVSEFAKSCAHPLMADTPERIRFPHSRWNEVQLESLRQCGYTILTQSPEGGVDTFVKKKKQSLFVHFQGHPEYGAGTLLKEYRRDIRRFLTKERTTYPSMPKGYFDTMDETRVRDFERLVLDNHESIPTEQLMSDFPEAALAGALRRTWQASSTTIYRNWLNYIVSMKRENRAPASVDPGREIFEPRRPAVQ
ncbi:MAG: homoserine O-succinyltransferase [Terriglobales bacterium]|jgi:homoserine O-succinyltransferase